MKALIIIVGVIVLAIGAAIPPAALGQQSTLFSPDSINFDQGTWTAPANSPATVTGTVVSSSGILIQGEPLYWRLGSGGTYVASGGPVYSGSDGAFSITVNPVPAGTYTITASESPDFCGTSCGLAINSATYVSSSASLHVLTADLSSAAGVGSGGAVTVLANGVAVGSCTTDQSASCSTSLPDGQYSVSATYQNYATSSPTSVSISGSDVTVQLTLQEVLLSGTLTMKFSASGSPVSGVQVTAGDRQATSGTNGSTHFSLPVGTYAVTFTPPSQYGPTQTASGVKISSATDTIISESLGTATGTLVFRDSVSNATIAGIQVTVAGASFSGTTGADGSVSFTAPDASSTYAYSYTATSSYGSVTGAGSISMCGVGCTEIATIWLAPSSGSGTGGNTCTLSPSSNAGEDVMVVNATGAPVSNARVSAGGVTQITGSDGHALLCNFAVPGGTLTVHQGLITISVSASGYKSTTQQANVVEGQIGSSVVQLQKSAGLPHVSGNGGLELIGGIVALIGVVLPKGRRGVWL